MGKIRILDDGLINRIAAGEVVERPASIVKELIENSIDAESRTVEIRLQSGGKRRIRVDDDGVGMDRDDVLLALERHATSKLRRADDLTAVATLGFRGEAIPSIAAVSRFVLRSAVEDGSGTEVDVLGGRIDAVRDLAAPRGTSVDVSRLFFNVPARRKFLRTDNTELSHAVRLVTRFALIHPEIRFRLDHGERTLIDAPRVDDRASRLRALLGGAAGRELLPFEREGPGIRVHGHAGRPVDAAPRRDAQHAFVNGRIVQDRVLAHAISAAYGNTVPKNHHAAVVLFVEIDPGLVDVNVHPQKAEVRFRRPSDVHDAVRDAIRSAFPDAAAIPRLGDLRPVPAEVARARDAVRRHLLVRDRRAVDDPRHPDAVRYVERDLEVDAAPAAPPGSDVDGPRDDARRPGLVDDAPAGGGGPGPRALAQIRDSYIVAEDRDGLVLVDQHAAHERVLFERFLAAAEADRVETQRLAFPVVVELSAHDMPVFVEERDEFRRLGFLAEEFGETAVRIDGIPAVFSVVDPESLFRELLGEASGARSATSASGPLRHRMVTTAACKAAIKIRRPMAIPEMQRLLEDLSTVQNPTTCPHGRPALFRLTLPEIERAFRRG